MNPKQLYRKISKNRKNYKRKRTFKKKYRHEYSNIKNTDISVTDLEIINSVFDAHKFLPSVNEGAWKVVPKDSCEVYRARLKRKRMEQNKEMDDKNSETSKSNKKYSTKQTNRKNKRRRKRNKERCEYCSSSSNTYTEESEMSLSNVNIELTTEH